MDKNVNMPNAGNGIGYSEGFNGIPASYDYINVCNSSLSPSTIHVTNTGVQKFFRRYLFQKAVSVFKWNLPENWNRDYFLYILYTFGFIGVIKTDKYGVICQQCSPYGFNIYYQPTNIVIANPLLKGITEPEIGTECTVFKLMPDWGGITDLVNYYADMMALCAETAGVNLLNSHLSFVFPAEDKPMAETFKKLFDNVASGQPATAVSPKLFNEDGTTKWTPFQQNIGQNYIVSDILADIRKLEAMFDTDIGIPNANTDKRERLITDEVNSNNIETITKCELWLESLQKSAKETNELFGLNITVDWRHNPEETKGGQNNGKDG